MLGTDSAPALASAPAQASPASAPVEAPSPAAPTVSAPAPAPAQTPASSPPPPHRPKRALPMPKKMPAGSGPQLSASSVTAEPTGVQNKIQACSTSGGPAHRRTCPRQRRHRQRQRWGRQDRPSRLGQRRHQRQRICLRRWRCRQRQWYSPNQPLTHRRLGLVLRPPRLRPRKRQWRGRPSTCHERRRLCRRRRCREQRCRQRQPPSSACRQNGIAGSVSDGVRRSSLRDLASAGAHGAAIA